MKNKKKKQRQKQRINISGTEHSIDQLVPKTEKFNKVSMLYQSNDYQENPDVINNTITINQAQIQRISPNRIQEFSLANGNIQGHESPLFNQSLHTNGSQLAGPKEIDRRLQGSKQRLSSQESEGLNLDLPPEEDQAADIRKASKKAKQARGKSGVGYRKPPGLFNTQMLTRNNSQSGNSYSNIGRNMARFDYNQSHQYLQNMESGFRIPTTVISRRNSQDSITKPGKMVETKTVILPVVNPHDFPETPLNEKDYLKRLRFDNLWRIRYESISEWKQRDVKGNKKNSYINQIMVGNDQILKITEKNALEKNEVYTDRFPFLNFRKKVWEMLIFIHLTANAIISTKLFDNGTFFVILLNTLVMTMDKSATKDNPQDFFEIAEKYFLYTYTVEMVMKIVGMGLIRGPNSYLRDEWNILDFFIVSSSWFQVLYNTDSAVQVLRTFRVMRPLKTISSVKGLKVLMTAVFSAIPLLKDTLIILGFFFMAFGIGGLQLMSGSLKQRCISIQTGIQHSDDIICGDLKCPGGYYCGKTIQNPNYGVTNFDNLWYAVLCVFQCVTLEGWSDIQSYVQRAVSFYMFLFFVPIVFGGAFLLLNLLLAVINSKFTEAHTSQQKIDQRLKEQRMKEFQGISNSKDAIKMSDQLTMSQFVNAKLHAKKMIEFLRLRQEIKKITALRIDKYNQNKSKKKQLFKDYQLRMKKKREEFRASLHKPEGVVTSSEDKKLNPIQNESSQESDRIDILQRDQWVAVAQNISGESNQNRKNLNSQQRDNSIEKRAQCVKNNNNLQVRSPMTPESKNKGQINNVILEDQYGENADDEKSSNDSIKQEIIEIVKHGKNNLIREGMVATNINIPKNVQINSFDKIKKEHPPTVVHTNRLTTMGIADHSFKKNILISYEQSYPQFQNNKWADELDIDNIIPKNMRKSMPSENSSNNDLEGNSFDLKAGDDNISVSSYQRNTRINFAHSNIPGLETSRPANDSGLITSDSNIEPDMEAQAIGINTNVKNQFPRNQNFDRQQITSKFKQVLKSNNSIENRLVAENNFLKAQLQEMIINQNSAAGFRNQNRQNTWKTTNLNYEAFTADQDSSITGIQQRVASNDGYQSQYPVSSDIEKKFRSIAKRKDPKDNYKTLNRTQNSSIEYDENEQKNIDFITSSKMKLRQVQEKISKSKPKNPYSNMDPLVQKVDIDKNQKYRGASEDDVFVQRIQEERNLGPTKGSAFIKVPDEIGKQHQFSKNTGPPQSNGIQPAIIHPYQKKVYYRAEQDSSSVDSNESSQDEKKQMEEQPYVTTSRIAYGLKIQGNHLKNQLRRSDMMVTSTLCFNLIPTDKRQIERIDFRKFTENQFRQYVDERYSFLALVKSLENQSSRLPEKYQNLNGPFQKSSFFKQNFETETMAKFKQKVTRLNSNIKHMPEKSMEQKKIEKSRHEQKIRASKKRGLPKFDLEQCQKLLDGQFHSEGDDEDDQEENLKQMSTMRRKSKSERDYQQQIQKFELSVKMILDEDVEEMKKRKFDEIPFEIRKTFAIPEILGQYQVDFQQIRKYDASKKKQNPMWSGQDVLRDHLNYEKSLKVLNQLNFPRVWPTGIQGIYKRLRYLLRLQVKSNWFDSLMTFAVLLNTIVLSLNKYGLTNQMESLLEIFNKYFTWIFIVEMTMKILAIGISKYISDKMNCLDGSVVVLSVIELIAENILEGGQGSDLSAFKTVRMLRTFRVFRIGRILRTLQSMKTIIGVMVRSYKSFGYITILMFLFIFIFSLLGMSTFGGRLSFEDGTPRGNFDSFPLAFITVFQVLTLENWQTLLFDSMRSEINAFLISIFYVSWIFLGNFILLNLFLAILLDSFLEEDEEEQDEEVLIKKKIAKRQRQRQRIKRRFRNQVIMGNIHDHHYHFTAEQNELEDIEDLDEEQIIQIFQQEGILEKDRKELSYPMYVGVDCQQSFFIFHKSNQIRKFCYKAYVHPSWERYVISIVMLSSVKLAIDSYITKLDSENIFKKMSVIVDFIFNFIFIAEMSTKTIALGLVMDNGSYLRDSWNQLDFFIVCSSILDMSLTGSDLEAMKILRILRTLRPLRIISNNIAMKLIVNALIMSINHILNVCLVIFFVFLIFAILGVNFYSGKLQYCSVDKYLLRTQMECERAGGTWKTVKHNFDDVGRGLMTLYVVASLEGWPDIMHTTLDITDVEEGPERENKIYNMVFFVIFIMIGSFFFLNFFVGVLFMKFNQCQKNEQKGFSQEDLGWQDIQRLILQTKPEYESTNVPKSAWRKSIHKLVSSTQFDLFIMGFILLNMLQMALEYDTMPLKQAELLEGSNLLFSIVFAIEAILKLIAYGKTYFKNSWNQFDFFVVIASIFDLVLINIDMQNFQNKALIEKGPKLVKLARILRVTRIIKLAGKAKNLQAIIQTISFSIPALVNVLFLLLLFFFMFSILGNFFFSGIIQSEVIDDNKNFHNFLSSFLMLIALTTGEDWNKVMFDCALQPEDGCIKGINCGTIASYPYFMSLIMICSYVMLNLFILVIIQQFEKYYLPEANTLARFKTDLISFLSAWKAFTQDKYNCIKLKESQLTQFFRQLGEQGDKQTSLGFGEDYYNDSEVKRQILKMGIKNENGYIFFNELLYRCMRRKYGNRQINKKMQIFELRTQYKIYIMTREQQNKSVAMNTNELYNGLVKKENGVNPFLTIMNYKISFKTWLKRAQIELKIAKLQDSFKLKDNMELDQLETKKTYPVEIEVEQYLSETSDDDIDFEDNCELGHALKGSYLNHSQMSDGQTRKILPHCHNNEGDEQLSIQSKASKLEVPQRFFKNLERKVTRRREKIQRKESQIQKKIIKETRKIYQKHSDNIIQNKLV